MKITDYKNFITQSFQNIATNYNMKWITSDDYIMRLSNENSEIYFSTEKYSDDLILTINNKKQKEYYTIYNLSMKILGNLDYLSSDEVEQSISFNDNIKSIVFVSSIFIKNYCQDLLNGDFSSVGKGSPL
ncbi:hypothetical protein GCM10022217_32480 [Chryseobacterium ginsenosidimutans]|uniref:hypothetical protein n=1 Tax=Chryseobacterium ginsenosidimutans TaxID=687846 RepID=UPI0031DBDEEF